MFAASPPDLIVQTRVKKASAREMSDDSPGLCDRFWACVLDDYLEYDVDDRISNEKVVVEETREDEQPLDGERAEKKEILKKKKKKRKLKKPKKRTTPQQPDEGALLGDLDHLLSEDSQPHRDAIEGKDSLISGDGTIGEDSCEKLHKSRRKKSAMEGQEPKKASRKEKSRRKRSKSRPRKKRDTQRAEILNVPTSPADEVSSPEKQSRRAEEVIQYAPLTHGSEPGVVATAVRDVPAVEDATLDRRSPVENIHEEEPSPESKVSDRIADQERRPKRDTITGYVEVTKPRDPPSHDVPIQQTPPRQRPTKPPHELPRSPSGMVACPSHERDLDEDPLHDSMVGHVGHSTSWERDTGDQRSTEYRARVKMEAPSKARIERMMAEGQRVEKEQRRRKLDRKEALHRIRAIKARLQTADP